MANRHLGLRAMCVVMKCPFLSHEIVGGGGIFIIAGNNRNIICPSI